MRDFQLPGRSPIRGERGRGFHLSSAGNADGHRGDEGRRQCHRCGRRRFRRARGGRAAIDGYRRRLFLLFAPGGGTDLIAYNGSGRSAKAASVEWYRKRGFSEFPTYGAHAVTVPGPIDAWARLVADHGKRDLGELLQPAIRFAENGYVVRRPRRLRLGAGGRTPGRRSRCQARILCPTAARRGRASVAASRRWRRHCAPSPRRAATASTRAIIAEEIVEHLKGLGGPHEMDDFATAAGEYVEPVTHELSRCRDLPDAAEQPGPDGAAHAEHPVRLRSRRRSIRWAPSGCIWRSRRAGLPIATATRFIADPAPCRSAGRRIAARRPMRRSCAAMIDPQPGDDQSAAVG